MTDADRETYGRVMVGFALWCLVIGVIASLFFWVLWPVLSALVIASGCMISAAVVAPITSDPEV